MHDLWGEDRRPAERGPEGDGAGELSQLPPVAAAVGGFARRHGPADAPRVRAGEPAAWLQGSSAVRRARSATAGGTVNDADYAARCEAASHVGDFPVPDCFVPPLLRHAATWGARWAAERLGAWRVPVVHFARATTETADFGVKGVARVGANEFSMIDDVGLAVGAGIGAHEATHC